MPTTHPSPARNGAGAQSGSNSDCGKTESPLSPRRRDSAARPAESGVFFLLSRRGCGLGRSAGGPLLDSDAEGPRARGLRREVRLHSGRTLRVPLALPPDCPAVPDSGGDGTACSASRAAVRRGPCSRGAVQNRSIMKHFGRGRTSSGAGNGRHWIKAGTCLTFKAGLKTAKDSGRASPIVGAIRLATRILRSRRRRPENRGAPVFDPSLKPHTRPRRHDDDDQPRGPRATNRRQPKRPIAAGSSRSKASAARGFRCSAEANTMKVSRSDVLASHPLNPEEPDGRLLDAAPRPENHLD